MKRARIIVAAALIGLVALVALDQYQPFAYMRVRNLYRDALARVGRKTPPNPDLVFLAIELPAPRGLPAGLTAKEAVIRAPHLLP